MRSAHIALHNRCVAGLRPPFFSSRNIAAAAAAYRVARPVTLLRRPRSTYSLVKSGLALCERLNAPPCMPVCVCAHRRTGKNKKKTQTQRHTKCRRKDFFHGPFRYLFRPGLTFSHLFRVTCGSHLCFLLLSSRFSFQFVVNKKRPCSRSITAHNKNFFLSLEQRLRCIVYLLLFCFFLCLQFYAIFDTFCSPLHG